MNAFKNYYRNKRVLVTGHTGFKGAWLCIWLRELGAEVVGYSLDPNTERDVFVLSRLKSRMIDMRGDIREFEKLKRTIAEYRPEIIFHLAAQPLVRLSYKLPRETFEQNVTGTFNILECVREFDFIRECILITSDKCYENKEWIWGYRENDQMGGHDPYSASKACAELTASAYIKSFFNPESFGRHRKIVGTVRAGNVLGGGDWSEDRIVPDTIKAIERNKPIMVRNPYAVRPWQHVLEPLSGYLWLAAVMEENPGRYSGAWNFGPDRPSVVPVKRIVEGVIAEYGSGSWMDGSEESEGSYEANILNLDCSKALNILKWKPTLGINECIRLSVEWYKSYTEYPVYELCKNQILKYAEKAAKRGNLWAVADL